MIFNFVGHSIPRVYPHLTSYNCMYHAHPEQGNNFGYMNINIKKPELRNVARCTLDLVYLMLISFRLEDTDRLRQYPTSIQRDKPLAIPN